MRLHLHPGSRCPAVSEIDVEARRLGNITLALRYRVSGEIAELRIPPIAVCARKDELWRHTCFEAFLRTPAGAGYCELNFAPSSEWAAYRFAGYRSRRRNLAIAAPRLDLRADTATFELRAELRINSDEAWKLGAAAVIEETNGNISYWALAHPPGKPDFHCDGNFVLELATAAKATP